MLAGAAIDRSLKLIRIGDGALQLIGYIRAQEHGVPHVLDARRQRDIETMYDPIPDHDEASTFLPAGDLQQLNHDVETARRVLEFGNKRKDITVLVVLAPFVHMGVDPHGPRAVLLRPQSPNDTADATAFVEREVCSRCFHQGAQFSFGRFIPASVIDRLVREVRSVSSPARREH